MRFSSCHPWHRWVEMLVSHHAVVSKAVHYLYHRCVKENCLEPVPGTGSTDRVSVHTIVAYLGYVVEAEEGICGSDDMVTDFLDFLRSLKVDHTTSKDAGQVDSENPDSGSTFSAETDGDYADDNY